MLLTLFLLFLIIKNLHPATLKKFIRFSAICILSILLFTSAKSAPKSQLIGAWQLVSGKHNGTAAPQVLANRIQYFNNDNTFESQINTPNGIVRTNEGRFYLLNDTTIVTYHKMMTGNVGKIANTYYFHIKNDTMHFYGYYLQQSSQNQSMLIKVYIDEQWVKTNKK
jgi:hypothetical protein